MYLPDDETVLVEEAEPNSDPLKVSSENERHPLESVSSETSFSVEQGATNSDAINPSAEPVFSSETAEDSYRNSSYRDASDAQPKSSSYMTSNSTASSSTQEGLPSKEWMKTSPTSISVSQSEDGRSYPHNSGRYYSSSRYGQRVMYDLPMVTSSRHRSVTSTSHQPYVGPYSKKDMIEAQEQWHQQVYTRYDRKSPDYYRRRYGGYGPDAAGPMGPPPFPRDYPPGAPPPGQHGDTYRAYDRYQSMAWSSGYGREGIDKSQYKSDAAPLLSLEDNRQMKSDYTSLAHEPPELVRISKELEKSEKSSEKIGEEKEATPNDDTSPAEQSLDKAELKQEEDTTDKLEMTPESGEKKTDESMLSEHEESLQGHEDVSIESPSVSQLL